VTEYFHTCHLFNIRFILHTLCYSWWSFVIQHTRRKY